MADSCPLDWIALSLLPGLGPLTARRAVDRFGGPGEVAFRVPPHALLEIPGVQARAIAAVSGARPGLRRAAEAEARAAARLGVAIVSRDASDYPATIAALEDPPPVLYLRGSLRAAIVRIAVVGARRCTAYGRRVAAGLGGALAERGVEVVSGGARGIDTCAHAGALDAGGATTAVLGSGFLRPYPAENVPLFERVAASGALVTEFPLEMDPRPENFPRRNRLISALSAAVVVVEAAARSGSLTTAAHALDQGREVMAVPGPISSDQSEGCHRLIQQGAKLVRRVDDILEELSPMYAAALPERRTPEAAAPTFAPLSADEEAVLKLLDDPEPVHVDELAEVFPFGVSRLHAALVGLVFRGAVEQLAGGYYLPRFPKPDSNED